MGSSVKLLTSLVVLVLGMTHFYSHCGLSGVSADVKGYNVCNRTLTDIQANKGGDHCTATGVFKSKSQCYLANTPSNNTYIYRYDYYQCKKFGSSLVLIRQNCSGELVPCLDMQMKYDVFNRFSGTTCTLVPPPPPPPPPPTDASNSTMPGNGTAYAYFDY